MALWLGESGDRGIRGQYMVLSNQWSRIVVFRPDGGDSFRMCPDSLPTLRSLGPYLLLRGGWWPAATSREQGTGNRQQGGVPVGQGRPGGRED